MIEGPFAADETQVELPEDGVAIIGMALRVPGADDPESFWANLRDGVSSIRDLTDAELDAAGVSRETRANRLFVRRGAVLSEAEGFDAAFFGIGRREAEVMDPQHRLMLELAWAALEDAGYDPSATPGRVGVFGGIAPNTYFQSNLAGHRQLLRTLGRYPVMLATEREYAITRISYQLGLTGPSIGIGTACSTSGVALHLACQSVLSGESDMALVGGARIRVPLTEGYLYEEDGILSPDGHCRAFDEQGRGTVVGNGGVMVVVKRLVDAAEDGDTIHAVVRGTGVSNDGSQKIGFTAPGVAGQEAAIGEALAISGIDPETITYLEAHGTGTFLGDPIEIAALTSAYARHTDRRQYCALGSVKTNIGHLDAGAGLAGVAKVVLAMRHRLIPPSLGFSRPNPQIDFANSPFYVIGELQKWEPEGVPRRAGVSSFGLGGTNAHIILEEPPDLPPTGEGRCAALLLLSAKSEEALAESRSRLAAFLEGSEGAPLADIAFTLMKGRSRFGHRAAAVAEGLPDAVDTLSGRGGRRLIHGSAPQGAPPVAFMFPGAGSHHPAMGRELFDDEPSFRESIERCDAMAQRRLDLPLMRLLFEDEGEDWLERPSLAAPALFVIEYSLAELWRSWGVEPSALIGHSMGEYTAACLSGVLSPEDALALVAFRGELVERAEAGAMTAIPLAWEELSPRLGDGLTVAAINAPGSCVVTGPLEAVERLERELGHEGVEARRLPVSVPYHSSLLDPLLPEFRRFLSGIDFGPPAVPFLSCLTGEWIREEDARDPEYWVRHLRETVRFADALGTLMEDHGGVLLEVGPGQTLSTLARRHPGRGANRTIVPSMRHPRQDASDVATLLEGVGRLWVAGVEIDADAFFAGQRRRRVSLPTYPFERRRYWIEPPERAESVPPEKAPRRVEDGTPKPAEEPARRPFLAELSGIFGDLSGIEPEGMDEEAGFLELGFDSLLMTRAAAAIGERFGIRISFRELLDEVPTLSALASYLEEELGRDAAARPEEDPPGIPQSVEIVPPEEGGHGQSVEELLAAQLRVMEQQLELLRRLAPQGERVDGVTEAPNGGRGGAHEAPPGDLVPLTDAQERLWRLARLQPESPRHNLHEAHRIQGPLSAEALEEALRAVAERHESLRASVEEAEESPMLRIAPSWSVHPILTELGEIPPGERLDRALQLAADDAKQPFDLAHGPLFRARLFRLSPTDHLLCLAAHHIVADGWSMGVIRRELGQAYRSLARGERWSPPQPPSRWSEIAGAASDDSSADLAYWAQQLAPPMEPLALPTSAPAAGSQGREGRSHSFVIPEDVLAAADRCAREHGTTRFVTLLAAFMVLLNRHSGQEDLLLCTPTLGRSGRATDGLVGYLNNIVVLRGDLSGDPTFVGIQSRLRNVVVEALEHDHPPFQAVAELPGVVSVPLTRGLFALQRPIPLELEGASVERIDLEDETADFGLACFLRESEQGMEGTLRYKRDLFEEDGGRRLVERYVELLRWVLPRPEVRISDLPSFEPLPSPEPARSSGGGRGGRRRQDRREEDLLRIWRRVFQRPEIGLDDDFFDLGGHSLLAARLFAEIEREVTGERLPLALLLEAPTVRKLAGVLREEKWEQAWSSVVPIQPYGTRPPLFFVHAHGGNVVGYLDLARRLGPDQPFYGLQAADLGSPAPVERSMPEIASHYVEQMREVQPAGPYLLGGWCFGGHVAVEMATQLIEGGERVGLLVMVDSPRPEYTRMRAERPVAARLWNGIATRIDLERTNLAEVQDGERRTYLAGRGRNVLRRLQSHAEAIVRRPLSALGVDLPLTQVTAARRLEEMHRRALWSHQPKRYPGRMILLRAEQQPKGSPEDATLGWGEFVEGELVVHHVPGHRIGLLDEPRVAVVAEVIGSEIERALAEADARAESGG